MKKVYAIEYRECDYDGITSMERSAFTTYRAASHFLMHLGYEVEVFKSYNCETELYEYDLDWTAYDEFTLWRAEIHELWVVE